MPRKDARLFSFGFFSDYAFDEHHDHSLVRLSTVPFYHFDLLLDKKNPILYLDVFTNSFLSSFDACTVVPSYVVPLLKVPIRCMDKFLDNSIIESESIGCPKI